MNLEAIVLSIAGTCVTLVFGLVWQRINRIDRRLETTMRDDLTRHTASDLRLGDFEASVEKELSGLKTNYNDKFMEMRNAIHMTEKTILAAIAQVGQKMAEEYVRQDHLKDIAEVMIEKRLRALEQKQQ